VGNQPEDYVRPKLGGTLRSDFLLSLVRSHSPTEPSILEIGCNVGRNLAHLHSAGFRNLAGVEINPRAIELLRREFPELAADADLYIGAAEEQLPRFDDRSFTVVFTMAVLVHIHPESESIFAEIERIAADTLIVIEDELNDYSQRHFQRNYRDVFEGELGLRQVEETPCRQDIHGLSKAYVARVFKRP
jgi:SAM-dependent methyltransferase